MSHARQKIAVALVYGGRSGEHEISVRSAESIKRALDSNKYSLSEYFIRKDGTWDPEPIVPEPGANSGVDVVFPALHGTFGEDGTIQGLLDLAELPYVGAGVLASAVSMDKVITKRLCKEAGLPVVEYVLLTRGKFDPECLDFPFPFPVFVKPSNLGSSVGITKAKNCRDLREALELAAQYDRKIIVERGVEAREFECAVLDGDRPMASVPCEIFPSQEFYTYEDKYLLNQAVIQLPAKLTEEQTEEVKRLALACFDAVGCEGMARVDFLMERSTGEIFVNEINTIPGFTSISMVPKMWEYSGIPYSELLDRLISLALERSNARRETRYSR
ncbi:MAG: D-alanine--D-alanine ligase family protein [Bryobacteraceae bacterium]